MNIIINIMLQIQCSVGTGFLTCRLRTKSVTVLKN